MTTGRLAALGALLGILPSLGGGCMYNPSVPIATPSAAQQSGSAPAAMPGATPARAQTLDVAPPVSDAWSRRAWIHKVARALRAGEDLRPGEDNALLPLTDDQIVRHFIADPKFEDTVLDFNLYFLGVKPNSLRDSSGNFKGIIASFPHAISAARAVTEGGDYFSLLDFEQPFYVLSLPAPAIPQGEAFSSSDALRKEWIDRINSNLQKMLDDSAAKPTDLDGFCKAHLLALNEAVTDFFNGGFPSDLVQWGVLSLEWYGGVIASCQLGAPIHPNYDVHAELTRIQAMNAKLFARIQPLNPDVYSPKTLEEVATLKIDDFGVASPWTQITPQLYRTLVNSSTNYDRKRAAYYLRRFFCDDLTPINVEAPSGHAQGRHASDPACFSCHYKLDPMAGFFRDYGINFLDFSKLPIIYFDDGVKTPRVPYEDNWRAQAGSGREWDVGYVRSVTDSSMNDYGSELPDLFKIIRRSPENKSCIMRRMFEYFTSENQAIDAGYLDYLARSFIQQSKTSSSQAFKNAVATIVTSNSFRQADPASDQCYDHAPGSSAQDSPPCKVAFILRRNCAGCHGSTSGWGSLDLSHWVKQADGTFSFPHLDDSGKPLSRQTTFEEILDRLSASDPERRMPYKSYMDGGDRETLYLWANDVLNGGTR